MLFAQGDIQPWVRPYMFDEKETKELEMTLEEKSDLLKVEMADGKDHAESNETSKL